jgi:WD40 repeat protein
MAYGSIYCRIWDAEHKWKSTQVIQVKSKERGGRTAITAAAYSLDGRMIAGAGQDGEIRIWASNGSFIMPSKVG